MVGGERLAKQADRHQRAERGNEIDERPGAGDAPGRSVPRKK
jgi:hypothetical protein